MRVVLGRGPHPGLHPVGDLPADRGAGVGRRHGAVHPHQPWSRPDEAGALLDRHGAAVLARLAEAERDLAARGGRAHRVRLGAFPTAMATLVPRAIKRVTVSAPELSIALREGTSGVQLRRLAAGNLDLAVVGATPEQVAARHPDVDAQWLLDDPLLLAVGRAHPLATAPSVAPGELELARWVVGSADAAEGLLGAWEAADWVPRIAFTARDWTTKLGLVAEGLGVTIVPGLSASAVPAGVVLIPIADPRATRPVSVVRPASASTKEPAQAVVTALSELAAQRLNAAR